MLKPHILFISDWYPSRVHPTLGNFIQKHAESVSPFCDVSVIHACVDKNLRHAEYEIVTETINGILSITIYYKKNRSLILSFSRYIKAYKLGYSTLLEIKRKPDLINLAVLIKAGVIAMYFKWRFGLRYVYAEHWTGFLSQNLLFKPYSPMGIIYRYAAGRSEVLMPVTENLRREMNRVGISGRFQIVSNVVDVNLFTPALQEKKRGMFKFIHISHGIDTHKNISGILSAVEKLSRIYTDFQLDLIINGEVQSHIAFAKNLTLYNTTVFFHGLQSTAEIARMMSESDCLVLFSNFENFPCVIAEALACGVPVISSDVGGIAEHLNEEMGILVQPNDEGGLVRAMHKVIVQHNKYDVQKLREYSIKHFSYETIGSQLFGIYKTIISSSA